MAARRKERQLPVMQNAGVGPRALSRLPFVRAVMVAGYVAITALGFVVSWQPQVFWTILLPLLPIAIVLMGFGTWRRICPLAWFGEVGRYLNKRTPRRVPRWLNSAFLPFTFGVLWFMLSLRLLVTNGDGRMLGGLLASLAFGAATMNLIFTGKSWCNFVCPVLLVERIYTEPRPLLGSASSQCERCTACKKNCPDIDQESSYWRDVDSRGRRLAYLAFPGLVLGFYCYYWLRHGDWEAYFGGGWTHALVSRELVFGSGLFFAPAVPAWLAAPASLLLFSALSVGLFEASETLAARWIPNATRRRHLTLALAAFAAFNLFYLFAGAPTLRALPGGLRVAGFAAPLVATLFLVRRWRRTHDSYLQEKSVDKLLRHWHFDEPPPENPGEVLAFVKAHEQSREAQLQTYRELIRETLADGVVTADEMRLLEQLRTQLGITEQQHARELAELSEEEARLFDPDQIVSAEEQLQREGYQRALATALLRAASSAELEALREEHGIEPQVHERILAQLRGESGTLVLPARRLIAKISELVADERVAKGLPKGAGALLTYVLGQSRREHLLRLLELLEVISGAPRLRELHPRLSAAEADTARSAFGELRVACDALAPELLAELDALFASGGWLDTDEAETPEPAATENMHALVERLAQNADPHVRTGAVYAAGRLAAPALTSVVHAALRDDDEVVRETAARSCASIPGAVERSLFEPLADDEAKRVRRAAREALHHAEKTAVEKTDVEKKDVGFEWASMADAADPTFSRLGIAERLLFLRRVPLFVDLAPDDLRDVARLTREQRCQKGEIVCEFGNDSNDLYIVVSGELALEAPTPEQNEDAQVERRGAGTVVGELAIVLGTPRSVRVRAVGGKARLLCVDGRAFRARMLPRQRIAPTLIATLAARLRAIQRLVAHHI